MQGPALVGFGDLTVVALSLDPPLSRVDGPSVEPWIPTSARVPRHLSTLFARLWAVAGATRGGEVGRLPSVRGVHRDHPADHRRPCRLSFWWLVTDDAAGAHDCVAAPAGDGFEGEAKHEDADLLQLHGRSE